MPRCRVVVIGLIVASAALLVTATKEDKKDKEKGSNRMPDRNPLYYSAPVQTPTTMAEFAAMTAAVDVALVVYCHSRYVTCGKTKPDVTAAARAIDEPAKFAIIGINCHEEDHDEMCSQRHGYQFPVVRVYKNGKLHGNYTGENTAADYLATLKAVAAGETPPVKASKEKSKKPQQPAFFNADVKMLTKDTFANTLAKADRALVMFYSPNCGHCKKAKDHLSAAATALKSTATYLVAAVDCTVDRALCEERQIIGFPMFHLYENGKLNRLYQDVRTQAGFERAMKSEWAETDDDDDDDDWWDDDDDDEDDEDEDEEDEETAEPPKKAAVDGFFDAAVHEANFVTFDQLTAATERALVMFYAPWCGHCKNAKPAVNQAAATLTDPAKVAIIAVDCTKNKALCQVHGVKGFPTFQLFSKGQFEKAYSGSRSADGFLKALMDESIPDKKEEAAVKAEKKDEKKEEKKEVKKDESDKPAAEERFFDAAVKEATAETFSQLTAASERTLVMFYAPWCGHCKKAKSAINEVVAALSDPAKASVVVVDCTKQKELCTENNVKGYPTIQLFSKGKFDKAFSGPRKADAFLKALEEVKKEEKKETKKEEKKESEKPAAEERFFDAAVKEATAETFSQLTAVSERTLVMFYAPWCGHCKRAKPAINEAVAAITDPAKASIVVVDCTKQKDLCAENNVKGYPTLQLFSKGKFDNVYSGQRRADAFLQALEASGSGEAKKEETKEEKKEEKKEGSDKPAAEERFFDAAVKEATAETFSQLTAASERTLVMFYAPWCGHCKRAKPAINEAVAAITDPAKASIVVVDCTKQKDLCAENNVKGYPTLQLFSKGKFDNVYSGQRRADAFLQALEASGSGEAKKEETKEEKKEEKKEGSDKPAAEERFFDAAVKEATAETFSQLTAVSERTLVMFYAPWCGHCKRAKPAINEAVAAITDPAKASIVVVDCTKQKDLCAENNVKGYPTLQLFSKGKFDNVYSGQRRADAFLQALEASGSGEAKKEETKEEKKEEKKEGSDKPAAEERFFDAAVKEATAETFSQLTAASERTLVMFYAPWCGHCKRAKPAVNEAVAAITDPAKASIVVVDCTKQKELCQENNVKGYPTFQLFNKDQFDKVYNGPRTADGFVKALQDSVPEKTEL